MNIKKVPMQIDIIYHKDFSLGETYAIELFKALNRNPNQINQHEIGIPIRLNSNLNEIKYNYADKTGIILLIDSNYLIDTEFREKIKRYFLNNNNFLIPVIFNISTIDLSEINSLNAILINSDVLKEIYEDLRITSTDVKEEILKKEFFLISIFQKIANEIYSLDNENKIKLFLSHTKRDAVGETKAKLLKNIIETCTKTEVFFDKNSIEIGSEFWNTIEEEIKNKETFLIAINSSEYSNSSWCRREILCAKKYRRPILVINALLDKQHRSFPYLGNTKVINLKNNKNLEKFYLYQLLAEVYLKAIRIKYKELSLAEFKSQGEIFINSPELLDFILNLNIKDTVYYPDPPLPKEEIELFEIFSKKLTTPLESILKDTQLKNKNIMLSISETKDTNEFQIKSFLSDLIRYFIAFDLNILYGGYLKYENNDFNLMAQILKVLDFYKKTEEISGNKKIVNYLAYPLSEISIDEEAKYYHNIKFKKFNPLNLRSEDSKKYLSNNDLESKNIWTKSLFEMRKNIVIDSNYIIISGGKLSGFKGELPGVLEEALIALEKKKPVYLIGCFGGVTKEIIDMLLKKESKFLYESYQEKIEILEKGIEILNNGLTEEENKILFELENNIQIIELILKGMKRLN